MQAYDRLETMEYIATLQIECEKLQTVYDLPPDEIVRILGK